MFTREKKNIFLRLFLRIRILYSPIPWSDCSLVNKLPYFLGQEHPIVDLWAREGGEYSRARHDAAECAGGECGTGCPSAARRRGNNNGAGRGAGGTGGNAGVIAGRTAAGSRQQRFQFHGRARGWWTVKEEETCLYNSRLYILHPVHEKMIVRLHCWGLKLFMTHDVLSCIPICKLKFFLRKHQNRRHF